MQCEKCGEKVYANENCVCGHKAPKKNNGIVRANTIICFILLIIAVSSLIWTLSLRTVVNKDLIVESVEDVNLADIKIDGGKKLDIYVYDEYINDPRITIENVDNLLKSPFIKDFIIEKVRAYQDFALDRGKLPYITDNDIVNLIDENSDLLFNEAGLRFLDQDKAELRDELSGLREFERFSHDFIDTYLGSKFVQTFFSYANVIFQLALMAIIFIQWLIIYKANDRRASKMIRKYGIAVIIPSLTTLIAVLGLKFDRNMDAADKLLGSAIIPFIAYSAAILAVGIILTVIGILGSKKNNSPKLSVSPEKTVIEAVSAGESSADKTGVQPAEKKANACPKCSYENKESAAFCSRCGTKLK